MTATPLASGTDPAREYRVRDPLTGRTIVLRGAGGPPTEEELEQVFHTIYSQEAGAPTPPPVPFSPETVRPVASHGAPPRPAPGASAVSARVPLGIVKSEPLTGGVPAGVKAILDSFPGPNRLKAAAWDAYAQAADAADLERRLSGMQLPPQIRTALVGTMAADTGRAVPGQVPPVGADVTSWMQPPPPIGADVTGLMQDPGPTGAAVAALDAATRDPAREVLDTFRGPELMKHDAWNAFYESPSQAALVARLNQIGVPARIKEALLEAKAGRFPDANQPGVLGRAWNAVRGQHAANVEGAADIAIGAGKRLLKTVETLGGHLRKAPGVAALDSIVPPVNLPVNLELTNTNQKVGGVVEQLAEVAAPGRAIYKAGVKAAEVGAPVLARVLGPTLAKLAPQALVEAGGNAALAKLQGASTGQAELSGALAAGIPTVGAVAVKLANTLRAGAAGDVGRFFNATTKPLKRVVEKRTPEVLARGDAALGRMGRSRESALETFTAARQAAGEAIDEALSAFGAREVSDAPARLLNALDEARGRYVKQTEWASAAAVPDRLKRWIQETLPDGRVRLEVPLHAGKVRQIDGLKRVVEAYGDRMSVDDLVGLRRAWDEVAYATPGATLETLKSQAEKWSKKMGGDAIRGILETDTPDLAAINREFSFWRDLERAMGATIERKRGQVGGLLAPMAENAGRVVGGVLGASHGPGGAVGGAILVGKAAKLAQRVFESPRYASLAANTKTRLAEALTRGDEASVRRWLIRAAVQTGVVLTPQHAATLLASGPTAPETGQEQGEND